jgi:hypothetical protein
MRAQLFSFDFVLAVSLIFVLFGIALYVSDSAANSINNAENSRDVKISGEKALANLVETPGSPANWNHLAFNDANVKSLGLASSKNVLNAAKVADFLSLVNSDPRNYLLSKRILGLDLPSSNYSILIYAVNGSALGGISQMPSVDSSVFATDRLAIMDSQIVRVALKVWVKE